MRPKTRTQVHKPLVLPELPAPNPLAKVGGLGELTYRHAVELWQHYYNSVYDMSQAYTGPLRLTGGRIEEDGRYGRQTNDAFKRWVNLVVMIGQCTGLSSSDVDSAGPRAAHDCLLLTPPYMRYGEDGILQLQAGWFEWKNPPSTSDGGGVTPPPPVDDGSGDGGGDGGGGGGMAPTPTPSGWLGGVLIAVDGLLGAGLAAWSKKWR